MVILVMEITGCRALESWECEAILEAFEGRFRSRDRALFELGIRTGFRLSELLSIKVSDVFDGKNFKKTVTVEKCWMKGRKRSRSMPLHHRAVEKLQVWLLESGLTAGEKSDWPLFFRQGGCDPLTRVQAWSIIKKATSRAGLDPEKVASHSMRKTFATRMWTSPFIDKDLVKMANLLGHQNYSNTLRYVQFLDGSLEKAVMAT